MADIDFKSVILADIRISFILSTEVANILKIYFHLILIYLIIKFDTL